MSTYRLQFLYSFLLDGSFQILSMLCPTLLYCTLRQIFHRKGGGDYSQTCFLRFDTIKKPGIKTIPFSQKLSPDKIKEWIPILQCRIYYWNHIFNFWPGTLFDQKELKSKMAGAFLVHVLWYPSRYMVPLPSSSNHTNQ